jgi:hypothetical protein
MIMERENGETEVISDWFQIADGNFVNEVQGPIL